MLIYFGYTKEVEIKSNTLLVNIYVYLATSIEAAPDLKKSVSSSIELIFKIPFHIS